MAGRAIGTFDELREDGVGEVAAAIVALAEALECGTGLNAAENLSHGIALGIRKGLFGLGADDYADIRTALARD